MEEEELKVQDVGVGTQAKMVQVNLPKRRWSWGKGDSSHLVVTYNVDDEGTTPHPSSPRHTTVTVPLYPCRSHRRRGWAKLHSSAPTVLAYHLLDGPSASPTLLLFRTRPTTDWMRDIPDYTPLGAMVIPGTHESCALYGCTWWQMWAAVELGLTDGRLHLPVPTSRYTHSATARRRGAVL